MTHRNYERESNGNFRPENYNIWSKQFTGYTQYQHGKDWKKRVNEPEDKSIKIAHPKE